MAGLGQKIIAKSLQRYWRMTRALTMGAQGLVMDTEGRVLLIKPAYRSGWHFPGGGVELNETVRTALDREMEEEAGVIVEGEPRLFSLYANFTAFPSDHIAFFVVHEWRRPVVPEPNREIAASGFFARNELPPDTVGAVRRRLGEVLDGNKPTSTW